MRDDPCKSLEQASDQKSPGSLFSVADENYIRNWGGLLFLE